MPNVTSISSSPLVLSLMSTCPFRCSDPSRSDSFASQQHDVNDIPEVFHRALASRHANHHCGFLLSRLAAQTALKLTTADTSFDQKLRGLVTRSLPGRGALSYSHETLPTGATPAVLAASLHHAPISACTSTPSLRVAVDLVSVERIRQLWTRKPCWPSRWLGKPSIQDKQRIALSHWNDVFTASAPPSARSSFLEHEHQSTIDVAVGWGVRECAVKLLGLPNRAFRMSDVTSVVAVHPPSVNGVEPGLNCDLVYTLHFDGGVDAEVWQQHHLNPSFRFGVILLRTLGSVDARSGITSSAENLSVVIVATALPSHS